MPVLLQDREKTALVYRDEPISYKEVLSRAAAYADSYKIKKGDRVIICSENRPEWIYAFYSVWMKGGITVPVDATSSSAAIAVVVKDCAPSMALCSPGTAAAVRGSRRSGKGAMKVLTFDDLPDRGKQSPGPVRGGDPGDTAMIMYTSGTTGKPKGVMLSYDNLDASIHGVASLGMLTPDDILIGLLPFHHIFPLQGTVIAPLSLGSTVVMTDNLTAEAILSALRKHRVTIFLGVPKLYELLHGGIVGKIRASAAARVLFALVRAVGSNRFGALLFRRVHENFGGHVHSYLTGGAPMNERVARDLWSIGFRIIEGYGLTETAPLAAFNPFGKIKLGTVGPAMAGTEIKIEDGEVLVRGRNVMKGYYKDPESTARKIRDGWFHTGDQGFLDRDGYLHITGRIDEVIVMPNGKKVNPQEIEEMIVSASPYVREAGVYLSGGHLAARIFPDFGAIEKDRVGNIRETIKWKAVDKYNSSAPPYRRILEVAMSREELPRTRLGKLKRYMLAEEAPADREAALPAKEPASAEYRVLKDFLASLSGTAVRPDSHLELDLGLDSLNRVELLAFIESAFGVSMGEPELAQRPTMEGLAAYLEKRSTGLKKSSIKWKEILKSTRPYPLPNGFNIIRFVRVVAKPLFRIYFKMRYSGVEHLPRAPFILSPNHQSFIDAVLLAAALPDRVLHDTFFIARDSLAKSKLLRSLLKKANVVFVSFERDVKSAMENAASLLKAGKNLVIFPEGHRTRDGSIAPFKKTFAILSNELNIPVVPVAISGAYQALPASGFFPRPSRISLRFLEPVVARGGNYPETAERIRSVIRKEVEGAAGP